VGAAVVAVALAAADIHFQHFPFFSIHPFFIAITGPTFLGAAFDSRPGGFRNQNMRARLSLVLSHVCGNQS
jgi:hypothetical protein